MNTVQEWQGDDEARLDEQPALSLAGEIIEVRRNAAVAAVVGALASAVAIAWFARAIDSGAVGDWILVVLLGGLGAAWLAACVDARTPLLVADDQGVRLRLGRAWVGLPWSAVDRVEHRPRRGVLRDGTLTVVAHNPERLLAELGRPASRQAALARRMYGAPLALPLGLGTRVVGGGEDLTEGLERLASRGAEVVVVDDEAGQQERDADLPVDAEVPAATAGAAEAAQPETVPGSAEVVEVEVPSAPWDEESVDPVTATDDVPAGEVVDEPAAARPRPLLGRALSGVTALVARRTPRPGPVEDEQVEVADEVEPSETPTPVRSIPAPSRTEVVSTSVPTTGEDEAQPPAVEVDFEEDQAWGERVLPIAREGHAVAPVVIDDFVVQPAADPVVGPELRAARTRLGLTTDQLAERTRIRPHVIEAIEVDDFVPCGGDFYARGHLRTLARVLGIDVTPLLAAYDERYAHAPVDPRRVFEAELATGQHGSIRGTRGGPNWSILVAVVMALVLAWSVARLVMDAPQDVADTPVLNGSGGPGGSGHVVADPVAVKVVAPSSGAEVVIRDAGGDVVHRGRLAIGESAEVKVSPPVRVQSSDGSVTVSVAGRDRGPVGQPGEPAQGTYAD